MQPRSVLRSAGRFDGLDHGPSQSAASPLLSLQVVALAVIASLVLAGCFGGGHGARRTQQAEEAHAATPGTEIPVVEYPSNVLWRIADNHANLPESSIVRFDSKHAKLKYVGSHTQGYATYRVQNHTFHIFAYSNVNGQQGFLYFASDSKKSSGMAQYNFTVKVPPTVTRYKQVHTSAKTVYDPYFNHPSGIQAIGHYLVVPVTAFHTANAQFYDAGLVYLLDLSTLRYSPTAPSRFKEILRLPAFSNLAGAGMTRLPLGDGRLALGILQDTKSGVNFRVYISSNHPQDVIDGVWKNTPDHTYIVRHPYGGANQGVALFVGESGSHQPVGQNVWMIVFDQKDKGGPRFEGSWADLYSLTSNDGRTWAANGSTLGPRTELKLPTSGKYDDPNFRWGGGIEIRSATEIWLYAVGRFYTGGTSEGYGGGIALNSYGPR